MRTIESIYKCYKCKSCGKEIILLSDEVSRTLKQGKYLSCSHCGSKRIVLVNVTDDFRECMKENAYKKVHGVFRQVRST